MIIVKEHIEFQRGQSSKSTLNVGEYRAFHKPFKWDDIPSGVYHTWAESGNADPRFRSYYQIILEKNPDGDLILRTPWIATTAKEIYDFQENPEDLEDDVPSLEQNPTPLYYTWWLANEGVVKMKKIDWLEPAKVNESQSFRRGEDTKKTLDVGMFNDYPFEAEDIRSFPDGYYKLSAGFKPDFGYPAQAYLRMRKGVPFILTSWMSPDELESEKWKNYPPYNHQIGSGDKSLQRWIELTNPLKFELLDYNPMV